MAELVKKVHFTSPRPPHGLATGPRTAINSPERHSEIRFLYLYGRALAAQNAWLDLASMTDFSRITRLMVETVGIGV